MSRSTAKPVRDEPRRLSKTDSSPSTEPATRRIPVWAAIVCASASIWRWPSVGSPAPLR